MLKSALVDMGQFLTGSSQWAIRQIA